MPAPPSKFCSQCGAPLTRRIPEGEDREREVCPVCNFIHYRNPIPVVGCVPEYEGRILLCLRAIEPRLGYWTVPAGFMELGETTYTAAARETYEEATAVVQIDELFAVYNIPHVSQVYFIYRAYLESPDFAPGEESLETQLFLENEIPWDQLAFPVVSASLTRYFESLRTGDTRPYVDDIIR